nr:SPOR domain-containing protein [Desulfobulbaceae bacterium]
MTPGINENSALKLWYTVQVGSFASEKDAETSYTKLSKELPASSTPDLRIEHIPPYFTVRIGKFPQKTQTDSVVASLVQLRISPSVIHAYYKEDRIIQLLNSDQAATLANTLTPQQSSLLTDNEPAQLEQTRPRAESNTSQNDDLPIDDNTLWHVIQLGSFHNIKDAKSFYGLISNQLPTKDREYLRIEKISSVYTVRAGKGRNRQSIQTLLDTLTPYIDKPMLMKAYYKEERIIHLQDINSKETTRKPTTKAYDETRNQQPASEKIQPETTSPELNIDNKEPEKVSLPQQLGQTEKPAQLLPAPKKIDPAPGSKEYLELVMARFLGTKQPKGSNLGTMPQQHLSKFTASPECLTSNCHDTIIEEKYAHMPAQSAKCLACHQQIQQLHPAENGSSFKLVTEGQELCGQCHQFEKIGTIVHSPFEEGNCLSCHNPHSSQFPSLAKVASTNQQDLCFECHDKALINKKMLHGPVGLGVCTFCHSPHFSEIESLLRQTPQDLCYSCHSEIARGLEQATYVHPVVVEQGCQSCHAVHGSDHPNLLPDVGMDFCYTCHTEIMKTERRARVKHDGLYLENKQCATCHLAHFSEYKALLPMDPLRLCLSCHGDNSSLESYSPRNIEQELNNKEYIHAPVAKGNCTGCHAAHGSDYDAILVGQYPTAFYAPYTKGQYELCFGCHDQDLLTEKSTSTLFRNGDQNLHLAHVGIARKGRTCQACHTPHASDGPRLINRTGASFGSWTMSINFTLGQSGGKCIPGCHREMDYDRSSPVNNSMEEKDYGKSYINYENVSQ